LVAPNSASPGKDWEAVLLQVQLAIVVIIVIIIIIIIKSN